MLDGWYDLETVEWKWLESMTFVAAMGPPSQGRQSITARYTRCLSNSDISTCYTRSRSSPTP